MIDITQHFIDKIAKGQWTLLRIANSVRVINVDIKMSSYMITLWSSFKSDWYVVELHERGIWAFAIQSYRINLWKGIKTEPDYKMHSLDAYIPANIYVHLPPVVLFHNGKRIINAMKSIRDQICSIIADPLHQI